MTLSNGEIADTFEEVADLLEIDGANPFRVGAYRRAAETIREHNRGLRDMVAAGEDLTALRGVGKDLAAAITELVNAGSWTDLDTLRQRVPPELRELLRIPGLGPKRVKKLHDDLGIVSIDALQAAIEAHKLSEMEGFGVKTEEKIARELAAGRTKKKRRLRATMEESANLFEEFVRALPGVEAATVAGSYRRKRDTVGDLDMVASARQRAPVITAFVQHPSVAQITGEGDTRAAVVLHNGIAFDLRVVDPASYGAALHYFTGSKDHNIHLREEAVTRGWKVNEYGVWDETGKQIAGASEEDVYGAFGLPVIPPELREMRGEFAAAAAGKLPKLIEPADIRGDIHNHSTWSDGKARIAEMTSAAIALGYDYLAITDHSPRLAMTGGLKPDDVRKQALEIAEVQAANPGITLLHGQEVDILKDGALDGPDDLFAALEIVIASVHSHFELTPQAQTERLLAAIANPYVRIIGHPQGRLLEQRDPIAFDFERVFTAAAEAGVAMEINADPHRLDLDEVAARYAKDCGVKFVINTDAHRVGGLQLMRHGVYQARRAWLEASDVLNTRDLAGLRSGLRPRP